MNLVIISGKIIKINYKIVDTGNVYAIAFIELKIDEKKDVIQIIAKNDRADEVFRKFNVEDRILVQGYLQYTKYGILIIANNIDKINFNIKVENINGKMDKKSI